MGTIGDRLLDVFFLFAAFAAIWAINTTINELTEED